MQWKVTKHVQQGAGRQQRSPTEAAEITDPAQHDCQRDRIEQIEQQLPAIFEIERGPDVLLALNDSTYRPDVAELESIKSRLEPLLEKQIDETEMAVLYSSSLSFFNRVPYLPGTPTKDPPRSGTRPWYRVCFQEGRVRCVFKSQNGQQLLHQRIFYDDAGAPTVVCEHTFGRPFPNAVHYLQYDERGYLWRYPEFWAERHEANLSGSRRVNSLNARP